MDKDYLINLRNSIVIVMAGGDFDLYYRDLNQWLKETNEKLKTRLN